jgi:hypothetical protein
MDAPVKHVPEQVRRGYVQALRHLLEPRARAGPTHYLAHTPSPRPRGGGACLSLCVSVRRQFFFKRVIRFVDPEPWPWLPGNWPPQGAGYCRGSPLPPLLLRKSRRVPGCPVIALLAAEGHQFAIRGLQTVTKGQRIGTSWRRRWRCGWLAVAAATAVHAASLEGAIVATPQAVRPLWCAVPLGHALVAGGE